MRVAFQMVDGRQKRWFPKVARAAAARLTSLSQDFTFELPGFWCAEFALNESDQTVVRHTLGQDHATTAVIFAAANWQAVDSASDDATGQLASALLCVVPHERAAELRGLFVSAGIPHSRRVTVSRKTAPDDPRFHAVVYFTAPGFEHSALHRLYDELDLALQGSGSGEVDGSGAGLGGYHLDVSLRERDAGLRSIFDFLRQHDIERHTRVTDARTGERLHE